MAFVRIEDCGAAPGGNVPGTGRGGARSLRTGGALSRPSGILMSIAVHLFLGWLVLGLSAKPGPADSGAGGDGALHVINLFEGSAGAAERPVERTPPPPPPPSATAAEVELTTPSLLPPPEWSVTRITSPQPMPPAPAVAAGSAAAAAGTSGGGPSTYDPFAGAAPLRDPNAEAGGSLFGSAPAQGRWELDETAFRAAIAAARRAGAAGGNVVWRARVSGTGEVVEIDILGGSASERTRTALRSSLLGRRLFRARSGQAGLAVVPLPTIEL